MVVDKWGISFLYPTKQDGFTWFQEADINDDDYWDESADNSGGYQFTMNFSGPTSGTIHVPPQFIADNAIGGCNMNFEDAARRGYTYKPTDLKNFELKFIMSTDLDGGFSVSQTAGKHSGSGCCSGFAYMINMECNTNPVEFRFRKEMWHVSYHTDPKTGDFTHPDFNFELNSHGNVGIGFVKYIKSVESGGSGDTVVLEFWGNPDPDDDPTNWILIKQTEDKGGWGNDGDKCNGAKDQVGSWGMAKWRLKSNSTGSITFKHLSLREIDPDKDFDGNPDDPGTAPPVDQPATTSTIIGQFKLQRDINVQRTNPCALTGNKAFYDYISDADEHNLSDSDVASFIKRLAQKCVNVNSALYQKVPAQFDVKLMKTGTPGATPTVKATIRSASLALKYTSPTEIDPTSLSGSLATRTFDFSTNTYTMQTGDRICVEYDGTSDSNYIRVGVRDTEPGEGDGTNSVLSYFDGDWHDSASRDLACTIYET